MCQSDIKQYLYHQATSHCLSQCWPRSMSPNGITRHQWVKEWFYNWFRFEEPHCYSVMLMMYFYRTYLSTSHNCCKSACDYRFCLNDNSKCLDKTYVFLAATKQLYKSYFPSICLSVRLSVCPSHLFDYVPIIVSSLNFQELLPMTKVRSMQKVKVRGQRSRSQRSQPNLTFSGL